jgi:hypothetical protein
MMMNPFKAMLNDRKAEAWRMVVAIDFEREVRQARCQSRGNQSSASKRSINRQ